MAGSAVLHHGLPSSFSTNQVYTPPPPPLVFSSLANASENRKGLTGFSLFLEENTNPHAQVEAELTASVACLVWR
jgi:hypothetical protein